MESLRSNKGHLSANDESDERNIERAEEDCDLIFEPNPNTEQDQVSPVQKQPSPPSPSPSPSLSTLQMIRSNSSCGMQQPLNSIAKLNLASQRSRVMSKTNSTIPEPINSSSFTFRSFRINNNGMTCSLTYHTASSLTVGHTPKFMSKHI